ncbi:MAG: replicative DNA helicase [Cytophagales bacterium]|nr:replicative DNA helicase [Cytophagales bacterium]
MESKGQKKLIPPHNLSLEKVVLGAMLLESSNIDVIVDMLRPEIFYLKEHQEIYKAILSLYEDSDPVDLLTVEECLKRKKKLSMVGGVGYLVELSGLVGSSANLESHVRFLSEEYMKRSLISLSHKIQRKAYEADEDVFELLETSEQHLFETREHLISRDFEEIGISLPRVLKEMDRRRKAEKKEAVGVPTGFPNLDRLSSGWQPSDFIVIAGRPSMGKTAFALSILRNAAIDHGRPVAMFSMEMSGIQLIQRLIFAEAQLEPRQESSTDDWERIRKMQLKEDEWEQLVNRTKKLAKAPIFIDESPALTVPELRTKARRVKAKHGVSLIILDYLQLMRGETTRSFQGNREQEIANISRTLKALAKELDIPIIALSQLSREVEKRGGEKRPILSDLRESGSIEQDADVVIFLYRPEYYGIMQDNEGNPTRGIVDIILAKHRNGPTGKAQLKFKSEWVKFLPIEYSEVNEETETDLSPHKGDTPF